MSNAYLLSRGSWRLGNAIPRWILRYVVGQTSHSDNEVNLLPVGKAAPCRKSVQIVRS